MEPEFQNKVALFGAKLAYIAFALLMYWICKQLFTFMDGVTALEWLGAVALWNVLDHDLNPPGSDDG